MARATIDPDLPAAEALVIETRWDELELIKQVPGFTHKPKEKRWRGPVSWGSYVILNRVFGSGITYESVLLEWLDREYRTRIQPAIILRSLTAWPETWPLDGWPRLPTNLYPFQSVDAYFLMVAQDAVLANDMGTGKTISVLAVVRALHELHRLVGGILPLLIICPNGVKQHWAKRVPEWFPEATPYVIPNTGPVGRTKLLDQAREDPNALVIINIEAVPLVSRLAPYGSVALRHCNVCDPRHGESIPRSRCEVHPKEFQDFPFKLAVLDEAHRIRNPKSKSTRAVWAVFRGVSIQRHIALTGTPIAQNVGDLWSVMHAIAPADYPTKSKWLDRYALMAWDNSGGLSIAGVRPDRRDEMFAVLDPRFRRLPIDVVLPQLPAFVREVRYAELSGVQLRMYRDVEKRLMTRTETGELFIAPNNLVKQVRLQQLAAGGVDVVKIDPDVVETWEITLREPSPKLDVLEEILEELGGASCAVGAEHLKLIDLAARRLDKLGVRYGLITGPTSTLDRERAIEDLENGRIRVLLFTLEAGGEGIDMSAAGVLIRLQRSWKMIPNIQSERRIRRIGSERHDVLRVIDVVTTDTIEETQVERMLERLVLIEEVNRDRAARVAAGLTTDDLDEQIMALQSGHLGTPLERRTA